MKKVTFALMALLALSACGKKVDNQAADAQAACEHEFVTDKYGVVQRIDPSEKNVYLVFTAHFSENDNGAFENFDGIIPVLDTLQAKGVKGSFFPTGACFREPKYHDAILRIINEGHYLSHHSSKHLLMCPEDSNRDSINLVTEDSIRADMEEIAATLKEFGLEREDYPWMIPPYEVYNQFSADILRDCGYKLVNPTQSTLLTGNDWAPKSSPAYKTGEEIMNALWEVEKAETFNGAVILIHAMMYPNRDDNDRTFRHLGEMIDHLRELGYDFRTFKDL